MKRFCILFSLLCIVPLLFARPVTPRGPVRLDDADPYATPSLIEHRMGYVRTTLSNRGVWGNPDSYAGFHGWEWPSGSGNNFLFSAGVWVGAQIDSIHRVSTTTDGDNGTGEFWPEHIGTNPPQNPEADWWVQSCCMDHFQNRFYDRTDSALAYEEFYSVFQDNIQLSYVSQPDVDGHTPLDIEIAQRTHIWPGFLARDIIFVDYHIRNQGTEPLHHVYIGLFADADIGAAGETGDLASAHDGNYYDPSHLMAVQGKFQFWRGAPTPGLFAMKVVATPAPLNQLRMTYQSYDRLTGGDPTTDADKYTIISSGEIADTSVSQGDKRFLLAFGASATDGFDLPANGTLSISVAFLSGANVDSLNRNADRAQQLFDSGFDYHPPAPADNFHVRSTSSGTVNLGWSPPQTGPCIGYNLFGRDSAGSGQQEHFNFTMITDTSYTVSGLQNGMDWLFQLQTEGGNGESSVYAELLTRVAAPATITGLTGGSENGTVILNWNPSPEPNVTGYRVKRCVILDTGSADTTYFDTTQPTFTDLSPRRGYEQTYRVQALNNLGVYSFESEPVDLIVSHPEHRILIMDETRPDTRIAGPIPTDSVSAFYHRVMNDLGLDYDYCQQPGCGVLDSLARYDVVIWVNENFGSVNIQQREALLQRYLIQGGKLLRIARHFFNGNLGLPNGMNTTPIYWASLYPVTLDSIYIERIWSGTPHCIQFSGAVATMPGFPNLPVDTARLHTVQYNSTTLDYVPNVDLLWPNGNTHVLYRNTVLSTDSSGYGNQPCGVMGPQEIVLTFPMYFLHENDVQSLFSVCIDTLRAMIPVKTSPQPVIPHPSSFSLSSYPNPFNPVTNLRFEVDKVQPIRLAIYNLLGQQVAVLIDGVVQPGEHRIQWNAAEHSSGLYFAVLQTPGIRHTQKLLLLK